MSFNPELDLRTPNIDRLMARGTTFTRCYTSSPLCAPARACLASGRSFERCPAPSNQDDYDLSVPTVYQCLRDTGYRVAGVGKFDLHKGLAKPLDWYLDGSRLLDEWGFTDGIDNEGKFDGSGSYRRQGGPKGPYMNFLHQEGVAEAYVKEHADCGERGDVYITALTDEQYCDNWLSDNGLNILRSLPAGQPWFIQVNFTGPHNPFDVTQRMCETVKDRSFPDPVNSADKQAKNNQKNARRYYAAMIENIDRQIGRFLDLVAAREELDNTLIVFCSDHGEMLGDHQRWGKSVWQEGSIHVPLVIAGPGARQGAVSDARVVLHDVTRTFIEAAGTEALADTESRSLWPVLRGETSEHRDHVLTGLGGWRCVVTQKHKWVTGFRDTPEILIDLENDPEELKNLAGNPAYSTIQHELDQHIKKIIQ
ncbi:MAG: sulfatase-like hydrolase/transferase [Lentisphaeria bacterium]|nr:sulfatase-like hydrolase/transferase [Lentisphaeria bacterium]